MKTLRVPFDGKKISISLDYQKALINLMKSECKMMRAINKEDAEYWQWGIAEIDDLSKATSVSFTYGGFDDHPKCISKNKPFVIRVVPSND